MLTFPPTDPSPMEVKDLLKEITGDFFVSFAVLIRRATVAAIIIYCSIKIAAVKFLKNYVPGVKSMASAVSTSFNDNNAMRVSFIRYLMTFHPDPTIRLDANTRHYDGLFRYCLLRVFVQWIAKLDFLVRVYAYFQGGYVICRTMFIDREVEGFINRGRVKQIIILGAGFDMRAQRLAGAIIGRGESIEYKYSEGDKLVQVASGVKNNDLEIRYIEIDIKEVQDYKLKLLRSNTTKSEFSRMTKHVTYLPCNFENPNELGHCLSSCPSFNPALSTLIVWEGVTMYLTKEAVCNTLHTLSEFFKAGHQQFKENRAATTTRVIRPDDASLQWYIVFDFLSEDYMKKASSNSSAFKDQRLVFAALKLCNVKCITGMPTSVSNMNNILLPYGLECLQIHMFRDLVRNLLPQGSHFGEFDFLEAAGIAECFWNGNCF